MTRLLAHAFAQAFGQVCLAILQDRGFVVSPADQHEVLGVWGIKIRCVTNDAVKVIRCQRILFTHAVLAAAWVKLALHRAEQVANINDAGVARNGFIEMLAFQVMPCMGVVVMPVT